jgi:hypothetical protein
MNYLKNPIIIGIIACLLTASYIYYTRKNDKNKGTSTKPFNFITPLAIGVIVWFIAESVITKISPTQIPTLVPNNQPLLLPHGLPTRSISLPGSTGLPLGPASLSQIHPSPFNNINGVIDNNVNGVIDNNLNGGIDNTKFGGNSDTIGTDGTNTYNIISKNNIKLPTMDVFIDLANFN